MTRVLVALGAPADWTGALEERRLDRPACVYFGRSTETYLALNTEPHLDSIASGPLVNDVIAEHREELLGFDDVLEYRDPLLWHAGDLAERLQTGSTFVYSCAAAIACARLLDSLDRDLVAVVDDDALRPLLLQVARERGLQAESLGGLRLAQPTAWARALRQRISFLADLRRRRKLLGRLGALRPSLPPRIDVLLATWADARTFTPGEPLERDTYFGELPRILRDEGRSFACLALPLSWIEPVEPILRNAVASRELVLLPEQCVSFWDGLRIVLRSLHSAARPTRPYIVGGVDLSPLLAAELRRERLRVRKCFALQFEYVVRALRAEGAEIARIVHPFENQSWEKVLRLAVREHLPRTRIVGFQASHIPNSWFSFFPSHRDLAEGQLPDDVVVFGRVWERLLAERGYPPERLRLGAALRFADLAKPQPVAHTGRTVLVAAPIGLDDALELSWKAVEALAGEDDVHLVLRLHPKMSGLSREQFLDDLLRAARLKALPEHITISDTPTRELLANARVLLYSSTVLAYEALAFGVTPVFVQSDFWLDLNSLPPGATVAPSAHTPDEIRAVVLALLDETQLDAQVRREEMSRLLADTFAPVTPETLAPLVG